MEIIQNIETLPWGNIFYLLRDLFIVLDIASLFLLIYFIRQALSMRPKFKIPKDHFERKEMLKGDKELIKRWSEIKKKSTLHPPQSYSLAVIEADTFIDSLLTRMGLEGKTMKEKLDQLDPEEIVTLKTLWRVHRIRNMLVHTAGFTLSEKQAQEVLDGYEMFLKELEIIET